MRSIFIILFLIPFFAFPDATLPKPVVKVKKVTKPKIFSTGARPRLQLGLQGGVNLNYFIYSRNRVQKDVALGYQGGVFFRVSRQKAFVQFEMNYLWSQVNIRNGKFTTEFGDSIPFEKLTFRYHTFGIPFIFGAYAVKKPMFKLRFYNGIEADFITKTRAIVTTNNSQDIYKLKRAEKRNIIRPEQFSYQLGMGMDIAMFIIDIKYSLGFRSFYREEFRTQTHLFQFTVGAIF
ncbi:MAG: hypothetical protein JWN78_2887 [Bacteroidota bacterium]|nr:hypothetical protein [Bacteroidota bacterium]